MMIPQLESLVLYDCAQITDVGVARVPALRYLCRLRLDYVWEATDISGEAVGTLSKLEELSLAACEQLTDVTLQALCNLRNLKRLILHAKGVVNSQQPDIVERAIRAAEWIADRLRGELPDVKP